MITDNQILNEFRKALKKYSGSDVLNLDDKFALQFTYTVQTFQEALPEFGYYIAPNKWSYYRIALVTKGSADYVCGIYKFKAVENTLLIIPARVINTSTNWARDTEGYAIIFNLDFFLQSHFPYKYIENKRVLQPSIQPYLRLTNEQVKEVEVIFKTILQEQQSDNPDKRELITLKMIELLIVAERLYAEVQQPEINHVVLETVKKFSDLVETNFDKQRSVSFYASQLNVHPNYLNSLVKSQTGLSAKESISTRLSLEAKYLLQTTALSVKEIAGKLGFDDANYFTSFFKRIEKTNPASYRSSSLKS